MKTKQAAVAACFVFVRWRITFLHHHLPCHRPWVGAAEGAAAEGVAAAVAAGAAQPAAVAAELPEEVAEAVVARRQAEAAAERLVAVAEDSLPYQLL